MDHSIGVTKIISANTMLLCDILCRSTLARVTSPRIRGLHHVDTLPEFAVDRDISGAMTIAIKNISKSKFNSLDNTESATRKIESIKRIRTNCKNCFDAFSGIYRK